MDIRTTRSPGSLTLSVLKYLSLIFGVFVTIVPMLVVFLGSFKTNKELLTTGVLTLPQSFANFDNYITAWVQGDMLLGFANTFYIIAIAIVATILTGTMTAYVLSRFQFKGKRLVQFLFLLASLIPSITMQMSTFQIIVAMGIYNTRLSTIVLFAGTDIISIYIFLQFLQGIPYSIDEAAIVDGASFPRIFFSIIFKLLKPAIMTVIIIKGIGYYNEFYTPFLYMKSKDLAVVSTALYRFKGPYGTQWEVICAGIVITMIPTLVIFLILQKHIYSGLTMGAVKG